MKSLIIDAQIAGASGDMFLSALLDLVYSDDKKKIAAAIFKAAKAVGGENKELAEELAEASAFYLRKNYSGTMPSIEKIQDIVEKILIETGHAKTAKAYILYRDSRARKRRSHRRCHSKPR